MNLTLSGMNGIIETICSNPDASIVTYALGALLGISELLAMSPRFRGNGILHAIICVLKGPSSGRDSDPCPTNVQSNEQKASDPGPALQSRHGEAQGDIIETTREVKERTHVRTSSVTSPKTEKLGPPDYDSDF